MSKKDIPKPDSNDGGETFWWVPEESASGSGTEDDPHVHETIHISSDGDVLGDSHTSVVVDGEKQRIDYDD